MPPPPEAKATNVANRACLFIVIGLVAFCGVGLFILVFFVQGLVTKVSKGASCAVMFEMVQSSAIAYSREHNGKLPDGTDWEGTIEPYYARLYAKMETELKKASFLKGFLPPPPGQPLECHSENNVVTGVAYNADVAGKKVSDVKDPETTVLFYETDRRGKNLVMPYKPLPPSKAPKMVNEQRDWIKVYVSGNDQVLKSSSSSANSFDISPDDAATPKPEREPKTPSDSQK